MDFSFTEAQEDLAGLTRRIVTERAGVGPFDRELWAALGEAGVLAAALPESVGGNGFGVLEQCSVLVELGRAAAAVPYLGSIAVGAAAIAEFGSEAQRAAWAVPAAEGRLVLAVALGDEPTSASLDGAGGWRLTGVRTVVPYAPVADAILVPAETGSGVEIFLVVPGDPGVRVVEQQVVDLGSVGLVELDSAVVPDDRRLAVGVHWLRDRATVGLCAQQAGVTERALELTAEHARTRVQFDKPIGSFQAVAQRLADAYIDVEAIRLALWQAAWRISEDLDADAEVATAKFWAADGGHRVAHTAVHVHGGMGIDVDYPVHRYFVAAKRNEFELGGATAQLLRLGEILASEPV